MPANPSSAPADRNIEPGRDLLAARYAQVRARSMALAAPLSAEDQCIQSMPDASPTKWHLAHTSWFFEAVVLAAHASGLRALRPALFLPLQLLLRIAGPAPRAAAARHAHAPGPRAGACVPRTCGRRDAGLHRRRGGRSVGGRSAADRTGPEPRAAAPGADPHRHPACAVVQPAAAGLSRGGRRRAAARRRAAGVDRHARRRGRNRPRRRGLRVRQRNAATSRAAGAVPHRGPPGHVRRVRAVHRRRRLSEAPRCGCPTAGRRCRRAAGRPRRTGSRPRTRAHPRRTGRCSA